MTVTLVTGANKGLGYEAARQLIGLGHTVYIGSRNVERGQSAAAELGAQFVQLEVTDDGSVASALADIEKERGPPRCPRQQRRHQYGRRGRERPGGTGALRYQCDRHHPCATQAALPLLEKSDNPVVVNVSSALGSFWAVTNPDRRQFHFPSIVYGSSKAAVSMLTVQYAKSTPHHQVQRGRARHHRGDRTLTPFSGAGQPVEDGAAVIVRMATIGKDGPTGTFQEGTEELGLRRCPTQHFDGGPLDGREHQVEPDASKLLAVMEDGSRHLYVACPRVQALPDGREVPVFLSIGVGTTHSVPQIPEVPRSGKYGDPRRLLHGGCQSGGVRSPESAFVSEGST